MQVLFLTWSVMVLLKELLTKSTSFCSRTLEGNEPPSFSLADIIPAQGAIILIDKPRGPSSHQVAAWVREMTGVSSVRAYRDS